MSENSKFGIGLVMIAGLCILYGITIGRGCNKGTLQMAKPDTITRVIERPITIVDTIKTKSVLIQYKDSIYFVDKPVLIPCKDTAFIAQADSVITKTKDTINMAFNYRNGYGHFSLVFKPRPDSVQTITVPIEKQTTNYEWMPAAFLTGLLIGIGLMK